MRRVGDANLNMADFTRANLAGAVLASTRLTGANLGGADLTSAYLLVARLTSANFGGAYRTAATLYGADLTGAHLDGVLWNRSTIWRANWAELLRNRSVERTPGMFDVLPEGGGRDRQPRSERVG